MSYIWASFLYHFKVNTTTYSQLDHPLPIQLHRLNPPTQPTRPNSLINHLIHFNHHPSTMKFSHSLLFNSVPEWTSHYLNYEGLKSAIYRFEKSALLTSAVTGPPTSYSDNPSTIESGEAQPATSSLITTNSTNEKVFKRMLDQELFKINEFYVDKEKELLGELEGLTEDVEGLERDEDEWDEGGSHAGVSVDSDDDEEDDEEDDEDEHGHHKSGGAEGDNVATRTSKFLRGAIANVFSNPANYDAAIREGRNARNRNRSSGTTATHTNKRTRSRGLSNVSKSGVSDHLIDIESGVALPSGSGADPFTPTKSTNVGGASIFGTTKSKPALGTRQHSSRVRSNSAGSPSVNKYSTPGSHSRIKSHGLLDEDDLWGGGKSDWAIDARIMFKRRITGLFVNLSELKQFVNLNYTGLSKVLKKYDKITSSSLRSDYLKSSVDTSYPFQTSTQANLTQSISSLVTLYAAIATNGDEDLAGRSLKALLREHVVWERNTVWREMIGLERRGWGTSSSTSNRLGNDVPLISSSKGETKSGQLSTPVGQLPIPNWLTSQVVCGILAVLLGLWVLSEDWFDRVEEQNCAAILAFVTVFWALEIVPLFVTALMVPFWVVVLRVIRSTDGEDRRLTASEATKYIFGQMFSPTIMLLLGGFTLAAALSKQNIDKVLATKVLSFAGTKPRSVLLAYMCVACFASMWISNVAAPVLCYSLIQPILRTLPAQAPFSKSLILGIALASNIGGMASPISSPQNLTVRLIFYTDCLSGQKLEYMNPPVSWLGWFAVSIPVASTSVFLIWLILLWSYRSGPGVVINPVRVSRETWTRSQWYVSIITILTIVLWCVESRLAWLFGDMGIIAIFPLAAFYGTGILRKADFDHSPWSIVFLAMGGIGLGKAVLSSGLLDDMDRVIQGVVLGLDIWPILALFSIIVLVIATLISHTIASVLVVPIAAQIGAAMEVPHPRLLILATALICSTGMGLPISGFPNLQAINVEDDMGTRYLQPSDFFKNGIPASIVATIVIITVGYGIMRLMGM